MKARPWTERDMEYVCDHYRIDRTVEQIARRLRRTVSALKTFLARHGLLPKPRHPKWNKAEDAKLRAGWGNVRTWVLAKDLGRSPSALKQRAARLGLECGRYYTDKEKALVRRLYPTHTAAQIAERLGMSPRAALAVWRLANQLGLRKWPSWEPETIEQVRILHGEGLTDVDIGQRMGLSRNQVHAIRYERLKLPPNREAMREANRRGLKSQLKTLGLSSPTELRTRAYRNYAIECGWPDDLRPREVQILNVLAARGVPMNRLELAEAIGMRTDRMGANGTLALLAGCNGPGGTYTASLIRQGLVIALKRQFVVQGQGKGRSRDLYTLGPRALAILEERAQWEATKTAR